MKQINFGLVLSLALFFCAVASFAAPRSGGHGPSTQKNSGTPANCNVVGIKSLDQYVVKSNRTCFKNVKQAEAKGFTALSSDSDTARGFSTSLSGANEVPANNSTATGSCLLVLNAAQTSLSVKCTHNVSAPIMAHIHIGAVGVSGGVSCDLGDAASPITAECSVDSTLLTALLAGNAYVNVHSTGFSGGEIRGQIG